MKFFIEENDSSLNVAYQGVTPDMFVDGGEVVVEGTLGKDGVFHANTLLTSCPSKYEAEKEAGKMHPGTLPKTDEYKKPGLNKLMIFLTQRVCAGYEAEKNKIFSG